MPSSPVLKRYYHGECTRCGRPRDADVWCRRCSHIAMLHGLRNAGNPGWWLTDVEWLAYRAELLKWASMETAA